jgi:protein tyrosine/serine phosphatase
MPTAISPRRFPSLRYLARGFFLYGVLPVVAIIGCFYAYLIETTNFHPVIAGELYRSSQPSASTIAQLQKQYGIRTIINLRGDNSGHRWYDAEIAQAKELDINHIDFRMSSRHELSQEQAAQLVQLMRDAPKPLLIHCQAGADRTGLATALYLAAIGKSSERVAEAQMSIYYGHIGLPISAAYPMDATFEKLEPWLGLSSS